tara:strand:- start:658 stop:4140 length:3483 start_codon:yes stop_codon:yes gene_type:complete
MQDLQNNDPFKDAIVSDIIPQEEDPFKDAIVGDVTTTKTVAEEEDVFKNAQVKNNEVDFDEETFTYEAFQQSPQLREAAIRFAKERLGFENPTSERAIDEVIEHFRDFNVNELTAAGDWNYVSALKTDNKQQQLDDYKNLYQAFDALPMFSGGVGTTVVDYLEGLATAPSTYLGLIIPGYGKVAGAAATATSRLAIGRLLNYAAQKPIRSTAFIEGVSAVAGDVAGQKALIEADVQDEYSPMQTALVGGISAALPVAGGLFQVKREAVKYIERNTGDLVEESLNAVKARREKAVNNAKQTISKKGKSANVVKEKLNALNQEMVEKGRETLGDVAKMQDVDSPIRLAVKPEKMEQVTAALTDILEASGGLKEGERITEGLARTLRGLKDTDDVAAKKIGEVFDDTLTKYNLTFDDLANIIMSDVSDAARTLQQAGQAKMSLNAKLGNFSKALNDVAEYDLFGFEFEVREAQKKMAKAIKNNDVREFTQQASIGRELDAARLAFMTSQTATTVRNVASGVARVGFDTLTRAVDRGLRKVTKQDITDAGQEDVLAVVMGITNKKEAAAIEQIFALGFEKEATKLFRQLQDIGDLSVRPTKMNRLANFSRQINGLNTISDNVFKRAALVGNLKRELNELYSRTLQDKNAFDAFGKKFGKNPEAEDFNLVEIIKKGRFNDVFGSKGGQDALKKAVDEALYFTYQKQPDSELGRMLINGIHKVPFLGTSFIPFPRFIMNAMKFTLEYSPIYLTYGKGRNELFNVGKSLVGMSKDEAITSYNNAAKGIVGTAFLLGAAAYRDSEFAGERWYEGKTLDGSTFDMRPFFPAAPYLFFGELLSKSYRNIVKGENVPLFGDRPIIQDAIQALSGTQFRAGMGLYALENAVGDLVKETGDEAGERVKELLVNLGANLVNTYSIPLTAGQDLYNTFLAPDEERIVRDTKSKNMYELFLNKSLSRLPGNFAIHKKIEELTGGKIKAPRPRKPSKRAGLQRRVTPITRQTFGLLKRERKNLFEKELDRLGMSSPQVYGSRSEVPEYDDTYNTLVSSYVDEKIIPYIKSKQYKQYDKIPEFQAFILKKKLSEFKQQVSKTLRHERTTNEMKKAYGFNPRAALLFNRMPSAVKNIAKDYYHREDGEPAGDEKYNYEKLYDIAKNLNADAAKKVEEKY